jgi:hypothetical protein
MFTSSGFVPKKVIRLVFWFAVMLIVAAVCLRAGRGVKAVEHTMKVMVPSGMYVVHGVAYQCDFVVPARPKPWFGKIGSKEPQIEFFNDDERVGGLFSGMSGPGKGGFISARVMIIGSGLPGYRIRLQWESWNEFKIGKMAWYWDRQLDVFVSEPITSEMALGRSF